MPFQRFQCWSAEFEETVEVSAESVKAAAEQYCGDVEQELDVLVCDEDGVWWEVCVVAETRYHGDPPIKTTKRPEIEEPIEDDEEGEE